MKCPYCGAEMEKGRIEQPRGLIAWTPEDAKVPFFFPAITGKCVILAEENMGPAFGSAVSAALCRTCGKVIIDFNMA